MTSPTTPGREPKTVVEIRQPRCVNRYGSAPCTASGGPYCYNTYSTCQDLANYDGSGSIAWRFVKDTARDTAFGDFSDADNIETNGIPALVSVSTAANKINPGANRDGESPFGVTGKLTVNARDIPWDDHVGDHYVTLRSGFTAGQAFPVRGSFWRLFNARNDFLIGMTATVFDGYEGQALSAMRQRVYLVENIDGPGSDGSVNLTAVDPLKKLNDDKTQYPPASNLELAANVAAGATSLQVFGAESDLTLSLGLDGLSHIRLGDEFITYSGYTDDGSNYYTLTGLTRGALDTVAEAHAAGDAVQRVARFDRAAPWEILEEIMTNGTEIPASYIPSTDWADECDLYIPSTRLSRIIFEPKARRTLCGEICQQAMIYVWWAEYDQEVRLLTIRPPSDPVDALTDDNSILDGVTVKADHEQRLTRVVIYYGVTDPFASDDDPRWRKYTAIDTDTEGAGVSPVTKTIRAWWVQTRSVASQIAVRLLFRYKETPRFLTITIDAKDREIGVGDLADVFTRYFTDAEGNLDTKRWQVISAKEMEAGHMYVLDMQTYTYVGRFGYYMDAGSPDYSAATEEERLTGGWYADATGLVDGDEGYKYQ